MSLTCPNCQHILEVKVVAKTPRPRRTSDAAVLNDTILLDVFSWMKVRGEQEGSTAALYHDYGLWTKLRVPPSKAAFAQALSRNGATKWRNAQARGWSIGTIGDDVKPATMTPEQRERYETDRMRIPAGGPVLPQPIVVAQPPAPDWSDLPFDTEPPA